ncbi:MAG: GNAT family N-acetyltransferase [Oscillospiraceae bacterium]|nr:GNAT family N-acetyltransferase [Oscillospiraceae bacterium]
MLEFSPVLMKDAARLHKYYKHCTYRLCEYSVGVKLMWRHHYKSEYAESCGCLIVFTRTDEEGYVFNVPVPLPGVGDVDAALDKIDEWCMAKGVMPVFSPVPAEERARLLDRYPYASIENVRLWQDYLYHAEDLATFAGRRYSGQRNHINKFRKLYPNAAFRPLTADDKGLVEAFWDEYHQTFNKDTILAKKEVCYAQRLMRKIGSRWVKAGAIELDGRLIAISLGEVCDRTLICHIEKALPDYEGVYPAMVQSFAAHFGGDLQWINREDDACDKGLRTSKMQYLPADMGQKIRISTRNELHGVDAVPKLTSERLTMDAITEADKAAYNRLCLDDERNRWWGYDYRQDLHGELTEDYFLDVVRHDFAAKLCVNFAVRLDGKLIGEAVLYRFNARGEAELGCRILPEYSGHGYGAEAFATVAHWSLYGLGLRRLVAKCFHENEASRRMLAACMRPTGEDEKFYYFAKLI